MHLMGHCCPIRLLKGSGCNQISFVMFQIIYSLCIFSLQYHILNCTHFYGYLITTSDKTLVLLWEIMDLCAKLKLQENRVGKL